ncbi:MAG: hypothetical protein H0W11_08420 [Gemmatimonadetes bacterium]|jgi:hypothetical protein|nr:hypothetical protein [Gemmatimonadota bacterium]
MADAKRKQVISIHADAHTAEQAKALAAHEQLALAQFGGEALAFWTSLPAAARAALRHIGAFGTEADLEGTRREVTRALLLAQRRVASDAVGVQIRAQFKGIEQRSEEEIEALAVDLLREPAGTAVRERPSPSAAPTEPDAPRTRQRRAAGS